MFILHSNVCESWSLGFGDTDLFQFCGLIPDGNFVAKLRFFFFSLESQLEASSENSGNFDQGVSSIFRISAQEKGG